MTGVSPASLRGSVLPPSPTRLCVLKSCIQFLSSPLLSLKRSRAEQNGKRFYCMPSLGEKIVGSMGLESDASDEGQNHQKQCQESGSWLLPQVLCIVSAHLSLRDVCELLCVSTSCHQVLTSHAPLWKKLELNGSKKAGERMLAALSLRRYDEVEEINLEFAQDVEDIHVKGISVQNLQKLNLNACQKITDDGLQVVAAANPGLKSFSIYWNLKITDAGVEHVVKSCQNLTELNLSGCKSITDTALISIATHCPGIQKLNLTRCLKLKDDGLIHLLGSCTNLRELYLYAIPNFTDRAFKIFSKAHELRLLDLCGAQYLTDDGVAAIAQCSKLVSLNLTWCVRVTSVGLTALAQYCTSLELLSLHGLLGVTDEGLEKLAKCCAQTLHTVDVSGCVNIQRRSRDDLLHLFPKLTTFVVHT